MIKKNAYLLLFVLAASFALISINYYTIKILSAVRAYINGESEYSKGQKDAALYLYTYIATEDTVYMKLFTESIMVPMSDNLARENMINGYGDSATCAYFIAGRNQPTDVPNMIWLFRKFQSTYMQTPIKLWIEAEPYVNQLYQIGGEINIRIKAKSLTGEDKLEDVKKISSISAILYKKESAFSNVLGDVARRITSYLLAANIFCILIILGSITLYAILMIQRLTAANQKLLATNKEVNDTNKELDTLVYSVSHDLRSPITSIQGLIYISKDENDAERLREYMGLILETINKQDNFILEIINFFKNKRTSLSLTAFSLREIVTDVLANNEFIPMAKDITVSCSINLDEVYTDKLRVKIIINNLISNAIKYSDRHKSERTIIVRTMGQQNNIVIEIADNGIGIEKKNLGKIYNMFFVGSNTSKGTGLGLYILKECIEKLNGNIAVQSELNVGTTFTVFIPMTQ